MPKKLPKTDSRFKAKDWALTDPLLIAVVQGLCANPNHSNMTPAQIAGRAVAITDAVIDEHEEQ